LSLGIDPVRFCSSDCFANNWLQHKLLHQQISLYAKQLVQQHSDTTQRMNTKTSAGTVFKDRKLEAKESCLAAEIEMYRYVCIHRFLNYYLSSTYVHSTYI
jgi:hypothetical protein